MNSTEQSERQRQQNIEQAILHELKDLSFGSIDIVVHDSKVVQIERKEKIRFNTDRSQLAK